MPFTSLFASIGKALLDFALPSRCPACGVVVHEDGNFCQPCWSKIKFLGEPCCVRCGVPMDEAPLEVVNPENEAVRCASCHAQPPLWQTARAAMAYGDAARIVAMRLKYGRRTAMAKVMAQYMTPHVVDAVRDAGPNALILPVPLHRWRLWHRGFNQALAIARPIGQRLSIPVEPFVLQRSKATRPLRDMNPRQRERTVQGAFTVETRRRDLIKGKVILLVDDIHTSGATATACTKILLKHGAASVHLLCWARVLSDDQAGH